MCPGACDDLRSVPWADTVLVGIHDVVEFGRIEHLLVDKYRLERPHPQCDIVWNDLMVVRVGMNGFFVDRLASANDARGAERRVLDEFSTSSFLLLYARHIPIRSLIAAFAEERDFRTVRLKRRVLRIGRSPGDLDVCRAMQRAVRHLEWTSGNSQ